MKTAATRHGAGGRKSSKESMRMHVNGTILEACQPGYSCGKRMESNDHLR